MTEVAKLADVSTATVTNHFTTQDELIAGESGLNTWPHGWAAYLMTRHG